MATIISAFSIRRGNLGGEQRYRKTSQLTPWTPDPLISIMDCRNAALMIRVVFPPAFPLHLHAPR